MKPYYEHAGITIYHGDCREILPQLPKGWCDRCDVPLEDESILAIHLAAKHDVGPFCDLVLTDPPYGMRSDVTWDDMEPLEFNRFSMEWISIVRKTCDEMISFFSGSSAFQDICRLVFERVRTLIWDKPLGSQYTGSSEKGFLFTYEPIAHCYQSEIAKEFVSPKDAIVGKIIKEARERIGMSRSGVDIAIRGKKTGLCFRWEEGACLPTQPQAAEIRRVLSLDGNFSAALLGAYTERDRTILQMREAAKESAARERDVLSYRTEVGRAHPCEKPEGLMRSLVRSTSKDGDLIVDPFAGSGTSVIAAKLEGRRAIGIEIEEKYCEIAAKRLSQEVFNFTDQEQASVRVADPEAPISGDGL